MKLFRQLAGIGVGLVAGVAAYALMKKYDETQNAPEQYVEVDPEPQAAPQPAPQPRTAPTVETPLNEEDSIWDLPTAEDVFANRGQSIGGSVNPVELGAGEKPPVVDGRIDVTKIADPRDFDDWDAFGCQG